MIIHFLDIAPFAAARAHSDPHVGVSLKEVVQILCDGLRILKWEGPLPRKPYNVHGRFAKWVAAGASNYRWLHELGINLYLEHLTRYGTKHRSAEALRALPGPGILDDALDTAWRSAPLAIPPLAGTWPADKPGTVEAHRQYYIDKLQHKPYLNRYKRDDAPRPEWIPEPGVTGCVVGRAGPMLTKAH